MLTIKALLLLTMKTQIKQRSTPYYGTYIYAVSFHLIEAACLRDWKVAHKVTASIERRKEIENFRSGYKNNGQIVLVTRFTPSVVADIHELGAYLRSKADQFKLVITPGQVYVYTNDLSIVQDLYTRYNQYLRFVATEAEISLPKDTIVLKNPPKFKYRTFFKERTLSFNTKEVLTNWITGMGDEVRPSPSFKYWLNYSNSKRLWRNDYLASHYYVEHNDAKLDTWMAMVCPGAIRKTVQVVQAAINN